MAKYCRYCGKSLPDDTIFCSSCGKKQSPENNMDADSQENMNTTTHSSSKNQVLVNLAECFETLRL